MCVIAGLSACGEVERSPTDGAGDASTWSGGSGGVDGTSVAGFDGAGLAGVAGSSAGGGSSAMAGHAGAPEPCQSGFAETAWTGVPVAADAACLDVERPELLRLCVKLDDVPDLVVQCYRRLTDGREFWIRIDVANHPAEGFSVCPIPATLGNRPPPCFATQCDEDGAAPWRNVPSTCDERRTRAAFDCGAPDSSWDERCCRRKSCSVDTDCAEAERCVAPQTEAPRQSCWAGPQDANDPAGDLNACSCWRGDGAVEPLCMPR